MLKDLFYFNDFREDFPIDVISSDKGYTLLANLPGFTKEEISLSFESGYLNITAKHKTEDPRENINYIVKERSLKNKKRSVYFGEVDEDSIKAKFENGVLIVSIEFKKPEEKTKSTIIID